MGNGMGGSHSISASDSTPIGIERQGSKVVLGHVHRRLLQIGAPSLRVMGTAFLNMFLKRTNDCG